MREQVTDELFRLRRRVELLEDQNRRRDLFEDKLVAIVKDWWWAMHADQYECTCEAEDTCRLCRCVEALKAAKEWDADANRPCPAGGAA